MANIESIFLMAHIGAGVIAIPAGFAALFVRKGARLHRAAGNLFCVSMLITGTGASYLGYVHADINDVIGGIMTIYFAATAWMAVKRKAGEAGLFEKAAFVTALAIVAASLFLAFGTANYIAAAIVALAAFLDLNVILRGGLAGKYRIARHVWRMCMSLFIAVGSFFLGQMQVFPEPIREIYILSVPVIAVLVLMIYWLTRVLFTNWHRKALKIKPLGNLDAITD